MTRDTAERAREFLGTRHIALWDSEEAYKEAVTELTTLLTQIQVEARNATLESVAMWLEANHRDDDDEQWEACCNLPDKVRALAQALQPEEKEK